MMRKRRRIDAWQTVVPASADSLSATWRDSLRAPLGDGAFLLCVGAFTVDAASAAALHTASERADIVVGTFGGLDACALVRSSDAPRLALLRNRAAGYTAMRDLLVRARQARLSITRVALGKVFAAPPEISAERLDFAMRRLVERLGWFGFVLGAFSRSNRNAEVWEYRRSSPETGDASCPLCGASGDRQARLRLHTTEDLAAFGEYGSVLCISCAVARTVPPPRDDERRISPDVAAQTMSAWQQSLLSRFIDERVRRVRAVLPRDRRPLVADVGGGACAFANALAASGCDVIVFEPNPANERFAATANGVRFVAAPFDEAAVERAAIADGSLDAMTMWHSLEHVPVPAATLALARRLLRPGGVLYVCVPNLDALQADFGDNRWCYLDIPHHVTHFTLEGLAAALERAGFRRPTPHWWSEEYEVFGFYQTLLNRLSGSHNYYYNRAKKGKRADAGAHPARTRIIAAIGPLFLPVALVASWWGALASKPACAELHATAE